MKFYLLKSWDTPDYYYASLNKSGTDEILVPSKWVKKLVRGTGIKLPDDDVTSVCIEVGAKKVQKTTNKEKKC